MTQAMTPVDWAKRPLEKYADFSGRAPRAEYWWYTLAIIVIAIIVSIVESMVGLDHMVGFYGPISLLFMLAVLVPGLAVTARRLHDTNRSGWWMLIAIVPYLIVGMKMGMVAASGSMTPSELGAAGLFGIVGLCGGLALLILVVLQGTKGDNRFGPDPYGNG